MISLTFINHPCISHEAFSCELKIIMSDFHRSYLEMAWLRLCRRTCTIKACYLNGNGHTRKLFKIILNDVRTNDKGEINTAISTLKIVF